jgi:hypothetical protein
MLFTDWHCTMFAIDGCMFVVLDNDDSDDDDDDDVFMEQKKREFLSVP